MKRKTKECTKCGKYISLSNYNKHFSVCQNKNKLLIKNEWKNENGLYECPICKKEFSKNGIASHIIYKHQIPRKGKFHPKYGKKGENSWSKANKLGIEHKMSLKQKQYFNSEICHKHLINIGKKRWADPKAKENHRKKMHEIIRKNPEKYSANNICGRTKIIEYNGFKLNGSWELIVAKWLDNNNIKWTNIIKPIPYDWNNETHLYFPDFYLIEYDIFIEVKGYERERDRCKWKVLNNLVVIKYNEINKIKNGTYIAQW